MPHPSASHPQIALLQTRSLASVVEAEIERMILGGELGPGERLTEVTLAAQLGVSRGPLREAFRMLAALGLVRTEKNRGVFVRDIRTDEALEIVELRAALGELAVRRVAAAPDRAALRELDSLVDSIDAAARRADWDAYDELDARFVARLVDLAGNRRVAAIDGQLAKELSLVTASARAVAAPRRSGREHRRLVAALGKGDAAAAAAALVANTARLRERIAGAPRRRSVQAPSTVQPIDA